MGDRSQVAIKQPGSKERVYLYSHWGGADIYQVLRTVIKRGQRLDDPEYFARLIFREMGACEPGETGFGIGITAHSDIEHVIPVLDCEEQRITFDQPELAYKNQEAEGLVLSFAEFAAKPKSFFDGW